MTDRTRLIVKRTLVLSAEILLVMAILALLLATWAPALVGARPGVH
jgi:hypothetical protein